ncbi:MAG: NADH-quinone oxidoreductase subunit NuoE [Desulfobacterales bacterium]|jgi:NADH-quinone oxidoreductase subunit E
MDIELSVEEKSLLEQIKTDLAKIGNDRSKLIPILQLVQQKLAYLPPESIHLVADHLDISSSEVYGVATFYNQFRFNPPGKNPVKVCLGTACHVKGGDIILENFERKLEIREGETTPDREFSVDRVACVGCCALAPVTVVGETVYGHMQPSKVEGLVLRTRLEKEMQQREKQKNEPTE